MESKRESLQKRNDKLNYSFTAKELLDRNISELPTLIDPIIPVNSIGILAGESDTGKSTFLRQLAVAIASGDDDFLGYKINARYNRVLYISTEDDDMATAFLLNTKMRPLMKNEDKMENLHFIFDSNEVEKKIEDFVKVKPVDLVIVDALSDLYTGDMNMLSKVRPFLEGFRKLAFEYGFTILFLHHERKSSSESKPSKHSLNGSQGLEGKCRFVFLLKKDKDLNKRNLCIVKQNYLSEEYKKDAVVLSFKNMRFSNTGDTVGLNNLGNNNEKDESWKTEAIRLRVEEGYTNTEIFEFVNEKGINVSRTKVGDVVKGYKTNSEKRRSRKTTKAEDKSE